MINQQRLKAYLDVVQGLLSCPSGEEWILLRQHPELVNSELVEVMEQVAHHLSAQGDIKAATYLDNWAGKLHHILTENIPAPVKDNDKTQAYLEFIQGLLDCPDRCEPEIIEAHQDLIDPGLIKMMRQIAHKLALEGNKESANYLLEYAADLNAVWLHKHEFEPTFKQEITADPWLDQDSDSPDSSIVASQPDNSEESIAHKVEQPMPLDTQIKTKTDPQPAKRSKTADLLIELESILATRLQPANPLWYMDVLEKALANNWILTTDEVEKLIGVKPHCEHNETEYHRGCWIFTKTGKVGAQTGWSVAKDV